MCVIMAHSVVQVYFPFTFFICAFWFVFFKLQVRPLTEGPTRPLHRSGIYAAPSHGPVKP
jgi:hypothetical protein